MDRINFRVLEKFSKDIERGFRPEVEFKLNRNEVELLSLVKHKQELPFREYGRILHLEKSSFTYLVDLLEAKDLIVKLEDENDRRKKAIQLTDKGVKTVEILEEQHHEFMQERFKLFNDEEFEQLKTAVKVIEKLLKKLPKEERHHKHQKHFKD
ncbi:MAG: winged helix DNA-binding protein [Acholeplasmataceae bacterium]|nr:winged helix DNA-binding protein [Acholeplasmataceae bacterium]